MPASLPALPLTRAERLKRSTHETHERLDQRIMALGILDSREQFARFLRIQYRLHRDVAALYADPALRSLLPDLQARSRLGDIERDLADLDMPLPDRPSGSLAISPVAEALGWLYVVEGSGLGGAVIYKRAALLGLDRTFGARHLAPPAGGIAAHWRGFTIALNAVVLPLADESRVEDGARAAFAAVGAYVSEEFA